MTGDIVRVVGAPAVQSVLPAQTANPVLTPEVTDTGTAAPDATTPNAALPVATPDASAQSGAH